MQGELNQETLRVLAVPSVRNIPDQSCTCLMQICWNAKLRRLTLNELSTYSPPKVKVQLLRGNHHLMVRCTYTRPRKLLGN